MKKNLIITLIILLALISCILLYTYKKQEPIEPMPIVESIVEETTEEEETTTVEEVESTTEQGTVEGYVSETPAEQEVLTGDEISLEDIPDDVQEAMDEIDKALSDTQKPAGVSEFAGTISKHNWAYPDDYVENGDRFIDRRGDIERKFDNGWIDETKYQKRLQDLTQQQGNASDYEDTGLGSGSMKGLAESIAESRQETTGEDSSTIPGGGDPIPLPKSGKVIVPDGRICY